MSRGSFGNNCIMLGKRRDNCTKGINEFSVADVTTLLMVTVLKESSLSLVQSSELPASILRLYTRWFRRLLDFKVSRYCEGYSFWSVRGPKLKFSWIRTTSILVWAFGNFKHKVLKYSRNCSLYNTLIPNLYIMYIHTVWLSAFLNHCNGEEGIQNFRNLTSVRQRGNWGKL